MTLFLSLFLQEMLFSDKKLCVMFVISFPPDNRQLLYILDGVPAELVQATGERIHSLHIYTIFSERLFEIIFVSAPRRERRSFRV